MLATEEEDRMDSEQQQRHQQQQEEEEGFVELLQCDIQPGQQKVTHRLRKHFLTLSFPECITTSPKLDFLTFRNYYTAYITIKQLIHTSSNTLIWRTILHKHALMADAHFEDDAQHMHTLPISLFNGKFEPDRISLLRIYMYQPSPLWGSFSLKNVECHSIVGQRNQINQSERFLQDLSSLTSLSDIASSSFGGGSTTETQTSGDIAASGKRIGVAVSRVLESLEKLKWAAA